MRIVLAQSSTLGSDKDLVAAASGHPEIVRIQDRRDDAVLLKPLSDQMNRASASRAGALDIWRRRDMLLAPVEERGR